MLGLLPWDATLPSSSPAHVPVVFCNFGDVAKVTPDVFSAWANILRRVPGSRLWMIRHALNPADTDAGGGGGGGEGGPPPPRTHPPPPPHPATPSTTHPPTHQLRQPTRRVGRGRGRAEQAAYHSATARGAPRAGQVARAFLPRHGAVRGGGDCHARATRLRRRRRGRLPPPHTPLLHPPPRYNSHTTAAEALAAGLPVITPGWGRVLASRVGASLNVVAGMGLDATITHERKAYEEVAVRLGNNPRLRAALRGRVLANEALFATGTWMGCWDRALGVLHEQRAALRRREEGGGGRLRPMHVVVGEGGCAG